MPIFLLPKGEVGRGFPHASGGYLPSVQTGRAGVFSPIGVAWAARLFVTCSGRPARVFLYLGPPRSANVVILRGERRNSGKLNAPSAFRSCKLVPTPFPAPRESAEKYRALFSHICGNYPFFFYILQINLHISPKSSIFAP